MGPIFGKGRRLGAERRALADASGRSHSEVFVNVMHAIGMEDTTFGDRDCCTGPIDSLV